MPGLDFVWDRLVVWVTVRTLIDWAHVLCDVELKAHEHYVRRIHGAERSIRLLMPTSKELRLLRRLSGTMAVSTAEEDRVTGLASSSVVGGECRSRREPQLR